MTQFNPLKFDALVSQIGPIIDRLVGESKSNGAVLTWRLLAKLENETFEQLTKQGLDPAYIKMLRTSPYICYPQNDNPVQFNQDSAISIIHHGIVRSFEKTH